MKTDYHTQAQTFLTTHGIRLKLTPGDKPCPRSSEHRGRHYRVTISRVLTGAFGIPKDFPVKPITLEDSAKDRCTCDTCGLSWDDAIPTEYTPTPSARCPFEAFHQDEDTPTRPRSISFDFWGSQHDAATGQDPTPYDVLACIGSNLSPSDAFDTFADFCSYYGYDPDSRTALDTFKRCHAFSQRLQAFFTPAEREALADIQ